MFTTKKYLMIATAAIVLSCSNTENNNPARSTIQITETVHAAEQQKPKTFYQLLADTALGLINPSIVYDPAYVQLTYPGGDVAPDKGVCTDVIIRAYRKMGIDLQKEVHEDMTKNFSLYPAKWGRRTPDKNIDHRRVPNLMTFFSRKGKSIPVSNNATDYLPGDIVTWNLSNGMTHIGMVVDKKSADKERYLLLHNIGGGQVLADCLFSYEITGHYRYSKM